MEKIRIGIIGCGTIVSVHLDAINALETSELRVVCDLDEGLVKSVAEEQGCRWLTDYKKVLRDDTIDLVHILTPHYLHVPMAIEALEAGKHVVLEKPVGIDFESLDELRTVAEDCDLTIGVTFQNRFNPTTKKDG